MMGERMDFQSSLGGGLRTAIAATVVVTLWLATVPSRMSRAESRAHILSLPGTISNGFTLLGHLDLRRPVRFADLFVYDHGPPEGPHASPAR